jgi:F-type H+-transporting ATPase subunit a
LIGVIPGFSSPTGNFSSNLAVGVAVFLYYNYVGIQNAGFKNYMAHFFGPSLGDSLGLVLLRFLILAPLMFGLEIFSHCVRPVTLALRLFVNINADHLVLGAFSGLAPLVVPVIFMAFGIFVAFIQAFVFSLLSVIYIGMAVQTAEHH